MNGKTDILVSILKILTVCILIYLLINKYNSIVSKQHNAPILIRELHHGKRALEISRDSIPKNVSGNGYTMMFWMNIDDLTYRAKEWKHVIHKGGDSVGHSPQPGVWLEPGSNNLIIRYKTSGSVGLYGVSEGVLASLNEEEKAIATPGGKMHVRYSDKTIRELKALDQINGFGGISIEAPQDIVMSDIVDDFKPLNAAVWKHPDGLSANENNVTTTDTSDPGDTTKFFTLIYKTSDTIAPVHQSCKKLTKAQCCKRVPWGKCVKGCPKDTGNSRNGCMLTSEQSLAINGWITYDKHYADNCSVSPVENPNQECTLCQGTGSGQWTESNEAGSVNMPGKGRVKYTPGKNKITNGEGGCYLESSKCLSSTGLSKCAPALSGFTTNDLDDKDFSTHIDNVPLNRWFHVAISAEDSIVTVYIDGTMVSSLSLPAGIELNDGSVHVTQGGGFGGYLTQLRVYGEPVKYSEIDMIHKLGPNPSLQIPDISGNIKKITDNIHIPKIKTSWFGGK